jgi:hypothetical protein
MKTLSVSSHYFRVSVLGIAYNGISLGEVADFGKINFQLKNKYDAKRKYQ